jgi:S-adenosylmethionine uptake transporter
MSVTNYIPKKDYMIAACWIVLVDIICVSNDVTSRFLGEDINPIQIAFVRFLVTMLSVLPFMLRKGTFYFKTKMPGMHFARSFLGAVAIGLGTLSVMKFQIACNTSITFSEPIMFLPLAFIFLKEKIDMPRIICTILGFVGIVVVLYEEVMHLNMYCFVPLFSSFLFAVICVLAKKMVYDEHIYTLLFYFGLGTTVFSLIPALSVWQPLTLKQIALLIFLGINGNLVQVCMFKAYEISDAAPLMTIRYLEFAFSCFAGFLFFQQIPTNNVFVGCFIIVLCSVIITIIEKRRDRGENLILLSNSKDCKSVEKQKCKRHA